MEKDARTQRLDRQDPLMKEINRRTIATMLLLNIHSLKALHKLQAVQGSGQKSDRKRPGSMPIYADPKYFLVRGK